MRRSFPPGRQQAAPVPERFMRFENCLQFRLLSEPILLRDNGVTLQWDTGRMQILDSQRETGK